MFLILLLLAAAGILMLLSLAESMLKIGGYLPSMQAEDADSCRQFVGAGILAGYALTFGLGGLSRLMGSFVDYLGVRTSTPVLGALESAGDSLPLLGSLIRALLTASMGMAVAVCIVVFISRFVGSKSRRMLLIVAGVLFASGGVIRTATDFLTPLVVTSLTLLFLYVAFRCWIGWNPIALGAWLFLRSFGGDVLQMAQQPDGFLRWNGILGAALWCIPILLALYFCRPVSSKGGIVPVEVIQ